MVSPKTVSYADRAKSGRPASTSAKATASSAAPVSASTPSTSSEVSSDELSRAALPVQVSIPTTHVPNGLDSASSGTNHHHSVISSDLTQPSPTSVNGADLFLTTAPNTAAALTPKQNVWMVRKELMNATRAGPHPSATHPQPQQQKPQSHSQSQTSPIFLSQSEMEPQLTSAASVGGAPPPSQIQQPQHSASGGTQVKYPKKKVNAKPATAALVVSSAMPPSFAEKSNWPAPNEAVASGNNAGGSTTKKGNGTSGTEDEGEKHAASSHSRDSSTTGAGGSAGHGSKKPHWVRVPASELGVDTAELNSPHHSGSGRGRRSADGEGKRNGIRPGQGGPRSSGQTSKRSSAAPSPANHHSPLTPSGTQQPLNVNAPIFSSKNMLQPAMGIPRSHPHSPLTRSPFNSSRSQSLATSPRMGGGYYSPKTYQQQHPLPPNPLRYQQEQQSSQPPPRKKVHRPSPSKASAVAGDIPQLPVDTNVYKPVFGSIEAVTVPEGGLGLTVETVEKVEDDFDVASDVPAPEVASDVVRWADAERKLSSAEQILRTEGKFGIGIEPEAPTNPPERLGEPVASAVEGDVGPVQQEGAHGAESRQISDQKWSFGSFDNATSSLPDVMTVDPTRRPSYTVPYSDTAVPNGMNGYAAYDTRGPNGSPQFSQRPFGEERSSIDPQGQMVYPSTSEVGVNGYVHRGGYTGRGRPGRGGPRGGGYGGPRGGGYGSRGSMSGYRNSNIHSPHSAPPQQPLYGYPQQYDMPMSMQYMSPPVDYSNPIDPYAPSSSLPPPTPGSAYPADSPYGLYPYGYGPMPAMGYRPPMGYYQPYTDLNGVASPLYPMSAYPPAIPYPALPPIPTPVTNVGYQLDPIRYALLGQVEYYFSAQNMYNDLFLRRHMNSQGWIPVNMIASFNRVRSLTMDVALVREIMVLSAVIELSRDGESCRMVNNGWEPYVLLGPDAQPDLQLNGQTPQRFEAPESETTRVENDVGPPDLPNKSENAVEESSSLPEAAVKSPNDFEEAPVIVA